MNRRAKASLSGTYDDDLFWQRDLVVVDASFQLARSAFELFEGVA